MKKISAGVALIWAGLAACGTSEEHDLGVGATTSTTTTTSTSASTSGSGGASAASSSTSNASSSAASTGSGGMAPFALTAKGFVEGADIPAVHECTSCKTMGAMNFSPELSWTAGPKGTMSYAIVMRDLSFMNGFVHWVIWDIPASQLSLPQDVDKGANPADVPGAKQAQGDYLGPCSCNSKNTYQWKVHAIPTATLSGIQAGATKANAAAAVEAASIASASLSGKS
jgi:Raf kinase inhibitor-like YbhB/YbcL family protein